MLKKYYAQKMGLDGMARTQGHRMRGTENDIAISLAFRPCNYIALYCITLYCSVPRHRARMDI